MLLERANRIYVLSREMGELKTHPKVEHCPVDFTDAESLTGLPDEIEGAAYCPGSINLRSFRSLRLDDFRQDMETNLMGAIKFLKACSTGLRTGDRTHPASVVLFSTVAVAQGLPMHSSVAAAKGAVEGLSRSLAAEWAPAVRVNCLAPALTDTSLASRFLATEESRNAMAAKYPLARIGDPRDPAALANFLLSPAAGWITGQVIGVDGGMSTLRT